MVLGCSALPPPLPCCLPPRLRGNGRPVASQEPSPSGRSSSSRRRMSMREAAAAGGGVT
uniref:Uncharacterized protein n=1 Tax=Arundo donax TaxID=35708 RepID=A0A0A8ZAL5_ARUDO